MKKQVALFIATASLLCASNGVEKIVKNVQTANSKSKIIQKKINTYSDKSQSLYDKYLSIKKELDEQKIYNHQLKLITDTQTKQIPKLKQQLKDIEITQKKIIPLMFEMTDTLDKFVKIDTPFLYKERTSRVKNLKNYLANPDISISEQFTMVLNSYKIEYNYARTLEVYRSQINPEDDNSQTVDFLRIGRLSFYYQSLDKKESAVYDLKSHSWVKLDESYNENISKAIKIARKKLSPDFLSLPILANKDSK